MRELEYTFKEGFIKGLRKNPNSSHTPDSLVAVTNAKPEERGLKFVPALISYHELDAIGNYTFPFPQIFFLKRLTLYITPFALYELFAGVLIHKITFASQQTVPFDVADYGEYVAIVGDNRMIIRDGVTGVWSSYVGTSVPLGQTITDFKGQMIIGNLQAWKDSKPEATVAWGRIGVADFNMGHYNSDLDSSTSTGARSNQVGYTHMKNSDYVIKVKRLGDLVILYGDNSIEVLSPVTQPVQTFSHFEMFSFGIIGKGAVGGTDKEHVFISTEGVLYKISTDGTQRLDYREFFTPMIGKEVSITYDSIKAEYYICDGDDCYILNRYGLGKTSQLVYSGGQENGVFQVLCTERVDNSFMYVSEKFDLDTRGLKTLYAQECAIGTPETLQIALDWKRDLKEDWRRTKFINVGPEGIGTIITSGSQFRFVGYIKTCTQAFIDRVSCKYKTTDSRSNRGGNYEV